MSLTQRHELSYWTRRFDCSEDELRRAVEHVGNIVGDVERYLRERRAS